MEVSLTWATPDGDKLVAHIARVSNPANEDNHETAPRLLRYLIEHDHWSPFEMVNACVQIETTRDITHQIIRHRSFTFQEFSGRYAAYDSLNETRECRMQDTKNRQNSTMVVDPSVAKWWKGAIDELRTWYGTYEYALRLGIAKEVARSLLPEGFVPSRLYMNGTLRSWIHYFQVRCTPETQKEHREVAIAARNVVMKEFPMIREALQL